MMECETNDCRKEKRGCKGCYYSHKEELEDTRNRNKKICKNCKYYEKEELYNHYGNCYNEKFEYNNYWSDEINKVEFAKDKLLYEDYEGYSASFTVGEAFGCIHFENKD